jgi:hypothetical protein
MFNIVKCKDFMLADDLTTWQEAEQLRMEKYGRDYMVVSHGQEEACTSVVPELPSLKDASLETCT